ncbi:MAG: hypothetical protein EPN85_00540 [Bacteroidetes bacterium]|nr:MAG: hypothetical protein EPN85_00540 [Bacteroidota bacterium]
METNNQNSLARQMDRQGLRVYAGLSAVVYLLALIYCFSTGHLFEAGLVGAIMLGLGGLIGWMYNGE